MALSQQDVTEIHIFKQNIGYFLKQLAADKQSDSASRRWFYELIGKEVELYKEPILLSVDTALRVDGENVFEISREMLEGVLSFIEARLDEDKTEYYPGERIDNAQSLYDRLRDETGHKWE